MLHKPNEMQAHLNRRAAHLNKHEAIVKKWLDHAHYLLEYNFLDHMND